jgi:hypothetical protein
MNENTHVTKEPGREPSPYQYYIPIFYFVYYIFHSTSPVLCNFLQNIFFEQPFILLPGGVPILRGWGVRIWKKVPVIYADKYVCRVLRSPNFFVLGGYPVLFVILSSFFYLVKFRGSVSNFVLTWFRVVT